MLRTSWLATAGVSILVLAAASLGLARATSSEVTRYDSESKYYRIRVVDYPLEGRRCMHFSKARGIQSSMLLDDPERLDLEYSRSMIAPLALAVPMPAAAAAAPTQTAATNSAASGDSALAGRDILLVGLGGASIPKFIQKQFPDTRQDIAEIDPDVVQVCQDWFSFRGSAGTRVIVMDGRMYLKRSPKTYDVILLDAYATHRIPFHLTTLEFLSLVKSRLKPGGVVAANLWEPGVTAAAAPSFGPAVSRFYWAELKTFQKTFPQTYLCKSGTAGKIIVFGTLGEKAVGKDEWVKQAQALAAGKDFGFDLPALVWTEYEHLTPQDIREKPLTDDMAPVDTLRHENPKHFEEDLPKK
ncbi:MAG: fused MFS/spermidine synthase [Planctomycetota bacterium]|nr:fused MFS/spermidine synthase [Planctomycetota bacterium]